MLEIISIIAFFLALMILTMWMADAGGKKQMEMEKIKTILLRAIIPVLLLVAIILLLRTCGKPSPAADNHKRTLDSIIAKNAEANRDFSFRIDSLTHEAQNKDTAIKVLHNQTRAWQRAAKDQADTAKVYVNLYRLAKKELDTAAMLTNCDELVEQFENLHYSYIEYMNFSDSLNYTMYQTIVIRDTLISLLREKDKVNIQTIADLRTNYGSLIIDYTKLDRKRSRNRWIDRGIGVGAGVIITNIFKK